MNNWDGRWVVMMAVGVMLVAWETDVARAAEGGAAGGKVTLEVTPKPTGQKYGPKNVMAAWVLDEKGTYIKTLARYGKKQASKLAQWKKDNPGGDTTDAVTGATRPAYTPQTFTWDGRDAKGQPVPDGRYIIRVEYTSGNNAGPCTMNALAFTRGSAAVTTNVPDIAAGPGGFTGLKLSYEPIPK
jgi:hypothetical protein